jgi:hypothetical protein
MPHPPDHDRPHGPGDGPIEPGSVLHRLLVMVAEAIARSRSRTPPPTERAAPEPPAPSEGPPDGEVPAPGQPAG